MTSFETLIARAQQLAADLPPDAHSMQVLSARQLLEQVVMNLQNAPTDLTVAVGRLLARYAEKMAERYTIREGLTVSFAEATAAKLSALVASAQALVAAEQPTATLWVDDGAASLDLSAAELLQHAGPYTLAFSQRLAWVSAKRQEIEASEDPLGVSLE